MKLTGPVAVFEAEAIEEVAEALSWFRSRRVHQAVVETDSLLTVRAVHSATQNRLEVGDVIDSWRAPLNEYLDFSVNFV